jgi:hypothetical protein
MRGLAAGQFLLKPFPADTPAEPQPRNA